MRGHGQRVPRPWASMGPGCFYPGNPSPLRARRTLRRLQWGRDVSIPEMHGRSRKGSLQSRLQWGRDVSIPEMPHFE